MNLRKVIISIAVFVLLCLCGSFCIYTYILPKSKPHQIYTYARMPDLQANQAMICGSGSHELKRSRQPTLTFLWQPLPLYAGAPPESYHPLPTTLHLNIVLVGPYATCGQLSAALSADDTKILGPKAVFLSTTTDDWTNKTVKQTVVVPTPGYYVFLEQTQQVYNDDPPFLNQYVTSLRIDP